MRTNIEIDDATMEAAMKAGPFKTKREAVEAGLKLLARRAAYQEVLKWRGKLRWTGDDDEDWSKPVAEQAVKVAPRRTTTKSVASAPVPAKKSAAKSNHGRR